MVYVEICASGNDYLRGPMHTPVLVRGLAAYALAQTMVRIRRTTQLVTRNMGHEQLGMEERTGGNLQLLPPGQIELITY